jgi:hypothetical protein
MARFTRRFARFTMDVFFAAFLRLATVRVLRFFVAVFFAAFLRLANMASSGFQGISGHMLFRFRHRSEPKTEGAPRVNAPTSHAAYAARDEATLAGVGRPSSQSLFSAR